MLLLPTLGQFTARRGAFLMRRTHVKNTKRFYVMNPTAEPLDFMWQPEVPVFGASDDECFKCLTKRGTILPNKKSEPHPLCACRSCDILAL